MGKRSNFERIPRDFYPTPFKAVRPLIPHVRGIRTFAEPCCGEGDLVRHLESFGLRCGYSGDIATGQDALTLTAADINGVPIITNPPFSLESQPLLRRLIAHFQRITSTVWLLLPADFASNQWFAPLLSSCSDIVAIGRVRWMAGTKNDGYDNSAWYRFDARHKGETVFHGRDRGEAAASQFALPLGEMIPSRRTTVCEQCGKAYESQRSSSRFCSATCRKNAHRKKLSVATPSSDSGETFRYVRHDDVPRFVADGWERLPALDGTHHGAYSALMRRVEQG